MPKQEQNHPQSEERLSSYSNQVFQKPILELVTLISTYFTIIQGIANKEWSNQRKRDDLDSKSLMCKKIHHHCIEMGIEANTIIPFLEGLSEAAKKIQNRCFNLWQESSSIPENALSTSCSYEELDAINSRIIKILSSPPFQKGYPKITETLFLELTTHLSLSVEGKELIDEAIISLIMNGALKTFLH